MTSPVVILGGGLAGTLLAVQLVHRGAAVILLDAPQPHSASAVAAGVWHGTASQRPTLAWRAAELLQAIENFLHELAFATMAACFHALPVYRPFTDARVANDWAARAAAPDASGWVTLSAPLHTPHLHNALGGLHITRAGWLDVPAFLVAAHAWLQASGKCQVVHTHVDYSSIYPAQKTIQYQGTTTSYHSLVFAEGIGALQNPFWPSAPLHALKGQLLELEIAGMPQPSFILVRGVYLLPLGGSRYLAGSTYEKTFTTLEPDAAGEAEILRKLHHLLPDAKITVLARRAGIRPTSPSRRPILGRHPKHPGLYFFNGLGTKGVLQGPWCAALLAEGILQGTSPWPPEIDLNKQLL